MSFKSFFCELIEEIDLSIIKHLNQISNLCDTKTKGCIKLEESKRYSLLSKGKRLRPLLVLLFALILSKNKNHNYAISLAMPSAVAVEFVHVYTMIHDDLPCMDNDYFRRGKFATHIAFDEATAILTGDALLADAFVFLSASKNNAASQCRELARAAGSLGVVSGQIDDLFFSGEATGFFDILEINKMKTASLLSSACALGALSVNAADNDISFARQYGYYFGNLFQIKDDLLDNEHAAKYALSFCDLKEYKNKALQFILSICEKLERDPEKKYLSYLTEATFKSLLLI